MNPLEKALSRIIREAVANIEINTERIEELAAEAISDDVAALMVAKAAVEENRGDTMKFKLDSTLVKVFVFNLLIYIFNLLIYILNAITNGLKAELKKLQEEEQVS